PVSYRCAILGSLARVVLVRWGRNCDGRAAGDRPWSGLAQASVPCRIDRGHRGALASGLDQLDRRNAPNRILAVLRPGCRRAAAVVVAGNPPRTGFPAGPRA